MGGFAELWVPYSNISFGVFVTGQWQRGIPSRDLIDAGGSSGPNDCFNLLAASPPTLLEAYEIVSFSIAWGALLMDGVPNFAPPLPIIAVEMALLVNDRVRYSSQSQGNQTIQLTNPSSNCGVNGTFDGDLVNPIRVGARDRLSLRMGVSPNPAPAEGIQICVGCQLNQNLSPAAITESTISYNVIDLPASRRL